MSRTLFKWALFAALFLAAIFLSYQCFLLANIVWWKHNNPSMTAFMEARLDKMRETRPDTRLGFVWTPYASISDNLKRAVLTSEDDKFADH